MAKKRAASPLTLKEAAKKGREIAAYALKIEREEREERERLAIEADASAHRPEGAGRFFGLHGDYQGDA